MYHIDELINSTVQELITNQQYGDYEQQRAIATHSNGKIATNIRLDCYQDDNAMYINGFQIMYSSENAKSLSSALTEYYGFDTPVIVSRP